MSLALLSYICIREVFILNVKCVWVFVVLMSLLRKSHFTSSAVLLGVKLTPQVILIPSQMAR